MLGLSKDMPWDSSEVILNKDGRYAILKGTLYQDKICLIGVYAPIGSQQLFWLEVFSYVGSEQEVLMLGDFNTVFDTKLDRSMVTGIPQQYNC